MLLVSSLLEMNINMFSPHISGDTWHSAHLEDWPELDKSLHHFKLATENVTPISASLKWGLTDILDFEWLLMGHQNGKEEERTLT